MNFGDDWREFKSQEIHHAKHGFGVAMGIYSYFAESERAYISMRTKQGLAALKAKGVKLGRPKGSKNKKGRVLDPHRQAIKKYLELEVSISDIAKIINDQLKSPITYNAFKYFIHHDQELRQIIKQKKQAASTAGK